MHPVDWIVVAAYFAWISDGRHPPLAPHQRGRRLLPRQPQPAVVGRRPVGDGDAALARSRWSARPGAASATACASLQFYFGLPLAMIILSVTVVPFFYRASVYTAYEYLERRFDVKTRTLTSLLFLLSRGLSCGAVIVGAVGDPLGDLRLEPAADRAGDRRADGDLHDARRRAGRDLDRRQADVRDRRRRRRGRRRARRRPAGGTCAWASALHLAGATGRLAGDRLQLHRSTKTYTFWSGLIGGLFLMLSYFGCDQSQVQRYPHREVGRRGPPVAADERVRRRSRCRSLVPLIGVLVFVFYVFVPAPMLFNRRARGARPGRAPRAADYAAVERQYQDAVAARRTAADAYSAARRRGADADGVGRTGRLRPGRCRGRTGPGGRDRHRPRRHRRSGVRRHQLRVPDLRDDAHADRAGRPDHRGDLRRRRCRRSPPS